MFDIGFWEIFLVGLIALIVLGPGRLPEAARAAGSWLGKMRNFVTDVKRDLSAELQSEDFQQFRQLKQEISETRQSFQRTASELVGEVNRAVEQGTAEMEPLKALGEELPGAPTPTGKSRKKRVAKNQGQKKKSAKKAATKKKLGKKAPAPDPALTKKKSPVKKVAASKKATPAKQKATKKKSPVKTAAASKKASPAKKKVTKKTVKKNTKRARG
ncbi:MAG: Sec-independent protein translocase protein TatB [Gammaproteobacteria bacterium]|nr:Sec-independent protein translocase protein TatB [Gammaproteobacteria bacterium]